MKFIPNIEEDGVSIYAWHAFLNPFVTLSKQSGTNFTSVLEFSKGHGRWCGQQEPYREFAQQLFDELISEDGSWKKDFAAVANAIKALNEFSDRALATDFTGVKESELIAVIHEHSRLLQEIILPGMPSVLVEAPYALASTYIQSYLVNNRGKLKGLSAARAFELLTHAPADSAAEHESKALSEIASQTSPRIAEYIRADPRNAWKTIQGQDRNLSQALEDHARKYCWAYYNYSGPAWGPVRFAEELAHLMNDGVRPVQTRGPDAAGREEIESWIESPPSVTRLLEFLRATVPLKSSRKDSMFKSYYAVEAVQREIGVRTGLSLEQVRYLLPEELGLAFSNKDGLASMLDARVIHCIIYQDASGYSLVGGSRALELSSMIATPKSSGFETELRGQCASTGQAVGEVRIVNLPADMAKMKMGDILVSVATTPDLVTAMKKASAIVADLGGITSHAAIVSRELGVPCVVGTKIATKVLKDGDVVEVDATNGLVRILSRAATG